MAGWSINLTLNLYAEMKTLNRLPAVDAPFSAANDSPANLLAWGWRLRLAEK
jgi:hypothetical protein